MGRHSGTPLKINKYSADRCVTHLRRLSNFGPGLVRFHSVVGAREAFSTCGYDDFGERLITCRTSIGMLVGTPPGPGATEIRPAMA